MNGENPVLEIIRCTIIEFTDSNATYDVIFRCHRSYVINLDKTQQVQSNATGYQLTMHTDLPPVAVSRSYIETFKKKYPKAIKRHD